MYPGGSLERELAVFQRIEVLDHITGTDEERVVPGAASDDVSCIIEIASVEVIVADVSIQIVLASFPPEPIVISLAVEEVLPVA